MRLHYRHTNYNNGNNTNLSIPGQGAWLGGSWSWLERKTKQKSNGKIINLAPNLWASRLSAQKSHLRSDSFSSPTLYFRLWKAVAGMMLHVAASFCVTSKYFQHIWIAKRQILKIFSLSCPWIEGQILPPRGVEVSTFFRVLWRHPVYVLSPPQASLLAFDNTWLSKFFLLYDDDEFFPCRLLGGLRRSRVCVCPVALWEQRY